MRLTPPECGQTVQKCGQQFFVVLTVAKRSARFVHTKVSTLPGAPFENRKQEDAMGDGLI
jgi:hypothetical protein